ncbi:MAG: uroporphyrinogen III synthase [Erythrobacter sp.]|nr:uroporphyrinogen III synthase [Erythrobacter sp.]
MSLPVIAIRPEPGLSATIAAGAAMGLAITGHPLARTIACGWTLPEIDEIDALLIGSANAIRHAGEQLAALRHLPVLAVGGATAEAAREAGLRVERTGEGGLQSLIDTLDPLERRHLLRLAGRERLELDLPALISVTTRIVYAVEHEEMTRELHDLLQRECAILLHSAGSAAQFSRECERLGVERSKIRLLAMGPRISAAAGGGWGAIHFAERPDEAALLALARDICKG